MALVKPSLSTYIFLTASFALVVFHAISPDVPMDALHSAPAYLMSDSESRARASPSDAGGQTASPNPSGGFDQEQKVRQLLAQQYEQRFGTSDEAIRSALGIRGKVADFVGYDARSNQWLIAESKATHINTATDQLENTAKALIKVHPDAKIELRLFLDAKTFGVLDGGGEVYGWRMNAQGFLGWIATETKQWVDMLIEGIKVTVQRAPK